MAKAPTPTNQQPAKAPEGELEARSYRERDQLAASVSALVGTVREADCAGRDEALNRFMAVVDKGNIETKVGDTMASIPAAALADLRSAQINSANIRAHFEIKVHRESGKNIDIQAKQEGGWKGLFGPSVSFSATEGVAIQHKRSSDMSSTMDVEISMAETTAPEGQMKLQDILIKAAADNLTVAAQVEGGDVAAA